MRVAHFSDPHLLDTSGARVRDFLSKRWIGGLNLLTNRARDHKTEVFEAMVADINAAGIEHVLCTGDVTNVALECEFEFSRRHFDRFAAGPAATTVIPGNHDAYVAAGIPLFARHFEPFFVSDSGWEPPPEQPWPMVRVRGEVAIIGCSTSRATPWFTAFGTFGHEQARRLEAVLSDARLHGKFRIVAIHHPPAGEFAAHRIHGLHDHAEFTSVLERVGAELVLHGHEHLDLATTTPGPEGSKIPVRGIQSASYAGSNDRKRARYRIYTIGTGPSGSPELVAEELRGWDAGTGSFHPE